MSEKNETSGPAAIIALATAAANPQHLLNGRNFAVVPKDYQIEDLERFLDLPTRKRGTVVLTELASFISYTQQFGENGTQVFAYITPTSASFTGILDYHEPRNGAAKWGHHRATFEAVKSVEWLRWEGANARWLPQKEFAAFLEDNLGEIVEPSGATMLEIAKTLEMKSGVEFKSGVRLDNGDHQIKYAVTSESRAGGNGELTIPQEFKLGIAPFNGGPAYAVRARLRYKIEEQRLVLRYELVQPHKVIEAAATEMVATIKTETDIEVLAGRPPEKL